MEKIPAIDNLRGLLERQLRTIESSEPGVRSGADVEDLHRFRVATRRSRALIRASRPLVGDQLAGLDAELRWLGGVSGPARDLDVLLDHLRALVEELEPDQAGGEAILATLEEERIGARETLVAAIAAERYRNLLAGFGAALPALTASGGGVGLAELAAKELKRLSAAYVALGHEPPDDELHAVRIKAKRARYAAELAACTEGRPLAKLAEAVEEVQDLIGAHQDAVVAEERVRALAVGESLVAAGRIVEHERARRAEARSKLPRAWKRVERVAAKAF